MNAIRKITTLTLAAAVALSLSLGSGCKKDEGGDEFLLIGIISALAAASSCTGGVPEVSVVNSSGRSANRYVFYSATGCSGTILATTAAVDSGSAAASVCVGGTSVGVRDQNGSGTCVPVTLFSGSKQTVTHTLDGSSDRYSVQQASSLLGFGGL